MGVPIKGELGFGDVLGLAYAQVADWSSGAAQTLFISPAGVAGSVMTKLIARSPTGTQPVSFTIRVNGQLWGATISLSGLTTLTVLPVLQPSAAVQAYAAPAQSITVTPLAASPGTATFDVQGYYF